MRLIDADKVKIESRKHCINCTLNGTKHCKTCVVSLICDRLDLQPTIEERKQGKWIKITKDGITPAEYTCSNCGRTVKSYYDDYFVVKEYPFCHCGASMMYEVL